MNRVSIVLAGLVLLGGTAWSQQDPALEKRLKEMADKLDQVVQENKELRAEVNALKASQAPAPMPAAGPATGAPQALPSGAVGLNAQWKDGFWLKSGDGNFELHPGGIIEAQNRTFTSETRANDTFFLREARFLAEGTLYHDYDFMLVGDFGKSDAVLKQAWAGWKRYPYLSFRMGEMKHPFSLESTSNSLFVDFAERSPAFRLTNEYETGAQVYGTTWENRIDYWLGVFNGGIQNAFDLNDGKDLVARLVLKPFAPCDNLWTKGIRIGGAVTYGAQKQPFTSLAAFDSGTTFLTALPGNRVVDARTRANVEGAWLVGPAKLQGEATWVNQGMDHFVAATSTSSQRDDINFLSWYVEGVCALTGEDAVIGRRHPKKNFLQDGGLGEVELAFRYGRFDVDEDIFQDGFADATVSTAGFDNYIGGVNWWFAPNVALMIDYFHTDFDSAIVIDHEHYTEEDGVLTRFQIDF